MFPAPSMAELNTSLVHAGQADWQRWVTLITMPSSWYLWGFPLCVILVFSLVAASIMQAGTRAPFVDRIHNLETLLDRESKAKKTLQKKIETFETALHQGYDSARDGALLLNPAGQIVWLNLIAEQIFKQWCKPDDVLPKANIGTLWPGLATSLLASALKDAHLHTKAWEGEITIENRYWLLVRVVPVFTGVLIVMRDMTDRHLNGLDQTGYRVSEGVLQTSPTPWALVDKEWRYLKISRTWAENYGISRLNSVGKRHFDLLPVFPTNPHEIEQKALKGETSKNPSELVKLKGQEEWVDWQVSPWGDNVGEINGYLIYANIITEAHQAKLRVAQQSDLQHKLAYHDALTGLPNRQLFYDRLNMSLAQAYRQLSRVALMFLDLDGFKKVNDELGHDAGDILLKTTAERLLNCVRKSDTVARLGGDEFTIIMQSYSTVDDVKTVARKVIAALAEPYSILGQPVNISVSIGISAYPGDGANSGDLIRKADTAMYDAKHSGKNTYRFYAEQPLPEMSQLEKKA